MDFNKERILETLREKAYLKVEKLRQDLAESLFVMMTESEVLFVFDKTKKDVVGGPFPTKAKASEFKATFENSSNLEIFSEKQVENLLKEETEQIS